MDSGLSSWAIWKPQIVVDTSEEKRIEKVKIHYREKKSRTVQKQVEKNTRLGSISTQRFLSLMPSGSESETKNYSSTLLISMPTTNPHSPLYTGRKREGGREEKEGDKGGREREEGATKNELAFAFQ